MKGVTGSWQRRVAASEVSKDTCSTYIPEWGDERDFDEGKNRHAVRQRWLLKEPVLVYGDIETDAVVGMLTLPHNGLRREIHDLYQMKWALSLKPSLRWRDIDAFSAWWNVFFGVCSDFLTVEEQLLFRFANFISYKPLQLKNRLGLKRRLRELGLQISLQLSIMNLQQIDDKFADILEKIDSYVGQLLTYFNDKEEQLAPCMRKKVRDDAVWGINQRLVDDLMEGDYGYYSVPILTRDLTPPQLRMFRRETLSAGRTDKTIASWWREVRISREQKLNAVLEGLRPQHASMLNEEYVSDESRNLSFRSKRSMHGCLSSVSSHSLQSTHGSHHDRSSGFLGRFLGLHAQN